MDFFRALSVTGDVKITDVPFSFGLPLQKAASWEEASLMSAVFTAALIARHSEKAVSVNGEKKDDGTAVIQWPFQGGDHQKWNLEATTGGYYVVRAVHSGKALSVEGESTANGAKVIQWGQVTGPHQQWRLVQKDNGYFALQNRHSDQYLSVNGESTDNGTDLVQWPGGDGHHQQFRLG
ncbi:hypothetical protein SUDANB180_07803 (plasmid) [Streptomyces sp. enrichment culture]